MIGNVIVRIESGTIRIGKLLSRQHYQRAILLRAILQEVMVSPTQ